MSRKGRWYVIILLAVAAVIIAWVVAVSRSSQPAMPVGWGPAAAPTQMYSLDQITWQVLGEGDDEAPAATPDEYPPTMLPPGQDHTDEAITGTVVDPEGFPVPSVRVAALQGYRRWITLTDVSGRFKLADVSPGSYSLRFSKDGYTEASLDDVESASTLSPVTLKADRYYYLVPMETACYWGLILPEASPGQNAAQDYLRAASLAISFPDYSSLDDFRNVTLPPDDEVGDEESTHLNIVAAFEHNWRLEDAISYVQQFEWIPQAEELIPWLEFNMPAINHMRRGARKKACRLPALIADISPAVITNTPPNASSVDRTFFHVGNLNLQLAMAPYVPYLRSQGKIREAAEVLLGLAQMGLHVTEDPFSVSTMIGNGAQKSACVALRRIVLVDDPPADLLRRIRDEARKMLRSQPDLMDVFLNERLCALSGLQSVFAVRPGSVAWVMDVLTGDSRRLRKYWDSTQDIFELPLVEALTKLDEYDKMHKNVSQRGLMTGLFMGSEPWHSLAVHARSLVALEALGTTAALALYHSDHDAYPTALSELVPEYLDAVPTDAFSGKEMLYRRRGEGYVLWSVSENLTDEGGHVAPSVRQPDWRADDYVFPSEIPDPPSFEDWVIEQEQYR